MTKGRLEAFSDGVFAIILTIMVLELKLPAGEGWDALLPLLHTLFSYLLSFVFVSIYWVNHHHMLQAVQKVSGRVLWMNLHLLFWLTLVPFGTAWLGESHVTLKPVLFYGAILLGAAIAYYLLAHSLAVLHGPKSAIARAIGSDFKGKLSAGIYVLALPLAFLHPWISYGLFVGVALMWLVPDPRMERALRGD
jgi:uncharacterized membrane protein